MSGYGAKGAPNPTYGTECTGHLPEARHIETRAMQKNAGTCRALHESGAV